MYTQHKQPGRFQANRSQLLAEILDGMISDGSATDEIGDSESIGHYARIDGERQCYICETNSDGFFTYQIVSHHAIDAVWDEVVRNVEFLQKGAEVA